MSMFLLLVATFATALFAGAAVYINLVEHPARVSCGTELAVREFVPSYERATVMQATLAVTGCLSGAVASWLLRDPLTFAAALLLGSVVPFTLVVIFPTNARLLDPTLDSGGPEAAGLLRRWGRLHAVRSAASIVALLLFLLRLRMTGAT